MSEALRNLWTGAGLDAVETREITVQRTFADFDDYWKQWSIEDHYANVSVPAYSVGGWYDIFQGGTVRNYVGLKSRVRGQRLIMGPWYHSQINGVGTSLGPLRWSGESVVANSSAEQW